MNHIINYRIVLKILSRNLFITGTGLMLCIIIALLFSEDIFPFLYSSIIAFMAGALCYVLSSKGRSADSIKKKDTYLTVTLSWFFIGLMGSLPYLFSGAIPSFVDACFESYSGFTTTGASILTDIEVLPKSILFWRSLTHWIGGIGIIVLVILIMPSLKVGGYHLFTVESSLHEKIRPRMRTVGYRILWIYIGLTLLETTFLLLGKMSLYDSICHAFGTVSTGGFSPKNTSLADYSPYIQYIVMIFMLLAATNFLVYFYILKREFSKVRSNDELKLYLTLIAILGICITGVLYIVALKPLETAFRESFFQVISIVTCTGFASADYLLWPENAWIIIFFAMFLGGCTGSTAGGIKMARHVVLLKNIKNIIRQSLSPNAILALKLNNNVVSPETNNSILTFISIYIIIFMAATLTMTLLGIDAMTASSSVATCMANIGPGIGSVGPASNFAHLPATAKIILTFLMILGRLEILTVIILFSKDFWKR